MPTKEEIISSMGEHERPYGDAIYAAIREMMRPVNVIELGTGQAGSFTKLLAFLCHEMNGEMLTTDILDTKLLQDEVEKLGFKNISFENLDDMSKEFIKIAWENSPYDVLMIDTSHNYRHTVDELETFSKMLAKDAVIILHDTSPKYNPSPYGIRQAVMEFLSKNLDYVVESDFEFGAGCMILRRMVR